MRPFNVDKVTFGDGNPGKLAAWTSASHAEAAPKKKKKKDDDDGEGGGDPPTP